MLKLSGTPTLKKYAICQSHPQGYHKNTAAQRNVEYHALHTKDAIL
jgi:hypothetical protein